MFAWLYDGTSIGKIGLVAQPTYSPSSAVGVGTGVTLQRRLTPTAAAHTYSVRGTVASGTGIAVGGAGGAGNYAPGFIRISRV
jgi:hypothetical protein